MADNGQSLVCIIAIILCKQAGLITNLAPFDSKKAKTCKLESGPQKRAELMLEQGSLSLFSSLE